MKLFVDAFPGRPEQVGKFILRDADMHWPTFRRAGRVRQADQHPCQPDIEPLEERSLNMLVGLPEATAKQSEECYAEIRPALQKRQKIALINDEQIAIGHRRHISAIFCRFWSAGRISA